VRRAFVVVIDACGVGALPDAPDYGDAGADTLGHLAELLPGGLSLPTLGRLGLGSIVPLRGVPPAVNPAIHGRLHALGHGKDSTAGHRELMGVLQTHPLPTYPDGFPREVVELVERASGRGVLCNLPFNGVGAIEEFGAEQLRTGALILYTSQDSVLQLAAHVDLVPQDELHRICARIRAELPAEHAVGRVIARPFRGVPGAFERTDGRRDLALAPPGRSYLEAVQETGVAVHTVGKTAQLFAGVGIDVQHPGATSAAALACTGELIAGGLDGGLVFTNLIDTDQVHGHRHDAAGFAEALAEIDRHVARWLAELGAEDLLILTADHGVDVTASHTDHTREHVPLLAVLAGTAGHRHDGPMADVGATVLHWLGRRCEPDLPGSSFLPGPRPCVPSDPA
jgi:phosphopentomutase